MIIALAQINTLVGDLFGNVAKIGDFLARARDERVDLVVFPELCITGYPPKDLLYKSDFVKANLDAVREVASLCVGQTAIVGFVQPNEDRRGRPLFNAAAVCRDGEIKHIHRKTLLPTYDVFDESRYFEPAPGTELATLAAGEGMPFQAGITICEDLWNEESVVRRPLYHTNPIATLAARGARFIINISASPFDVTKNAIRTNIFGAQARNNGVMLAYSNQMGGNDDLIFDGASALFDATGQVVARAHAFREDLLVVNLDQPGKARLEPYPSPIASIYEALVLGTRDYVLKCGFKSVVLGLSGGIDSAVTAAIAVDALGAPAVRGVGMPSRYSSEHSVADARQLAANIGIDFDLIPIDGAHAAMEGALAGVFTGLSADATEENIQARIRGNILMALSNKFGSLLLTTGNKSELAVGYCTLYGDMCGGLAVISDVPKTTVYELARYINQRAGFDRIPAGTITKPPSAELKPNQTDQDTLPPYEILDAILRRYIEEHQSAEQIIAAGFDRAVVRDIISRVDRNEYKRKQAALGLKVTSRAFGTGRRMPIAARHTP